ncbi:MAG: response regulator [Pseudomonadota bacterium]
MSHPSPSAPEPHILVVDDTRDIRDLLARYLRRNGMRVSTAEGAAEARRTLAAAAIDLAVLDVMMPGEDGLSLTRSLREEGRVPVILLTAMSEETDRIVGLEVGADDYVTKPFNPRELLARIRAVLRRAQALPASREPVAANRLAFAGWTMDLDAREIVGADGVAAPLSTGEFRMLAAFLERPGLVLTRDQLLDLTRGRAAVPFDRSVDNQVSRLRRKIEPDPAHPTLIQTVRGDGYRFSANVTREGDGGLGDAG